MHETAIAMGLLDIVTKRAAEHGFDRVTEIRLKLGRLRGLDARQLRAAFEVIAEDGPAAGATMLVEEVAVAARCRGCGTDFSVEGWRFVCPACGGSDADVTAGRELYVESFTGTRSGERPPP